MGFFPVRCEGFQNHIRHPYLLETKFRLLHIGLFDHVYLKLIAGYHYNFFLMKKRNKHFFFRCVIKIRHYCLPHFFVLKKKRGSDPEILSLKFHTLVFVERENALTFQKDKFQCILWI